MKRFFLLTLSFFIILIAIDAYAETRQQKVENIDAQIAELEDMKRGYESRALRHEDYATYLQFENQAWLETRRHIQIAEENRAKAAYLQERIDKLEAEKKKLSRS